MKVAGYILIITGVVTAGKLSDFIICRYLGKLCFSKMWHLLIWLKFITIHSLLPEPEQLYELPKTPKTEKIEDALLCQSPLVSLIFCCTSFICIMQNWPFNLNVTDFFVFLQDNVLPNASEQKSCLLALTAHNWLYRLSADTGRMLQRVYLSSRFKFRWSLIFTVVLKRRWVSANHFDNNNKLHFVSCYSTISG